MIERTSAPRTAAPVEGGMTLANAPAAPVDALPAPEALNDVGAQIATLLLLSQKQRRDVARAGRDAAYDALEAAQKEELSEMKSASQARFVTGMTRGAFELGSAGATFASARNEAKVGTYEERLDTRGTKQAIAGHKADGARWQAASKAAEAGGTMASAAGDLVAGTDDRQAKDAAMRADRAKRSAEESQDDLREADESTTKTLAFLKQWTETRDATRLATIHRV